MRRLLLPLALAAVAGCGEDDGPVPVHPVSGQLIYDGKPAAGVRVTFVPTDAPIPPRIPKYPSAVTDPGGKFRLTTYKDGDGAAEGTYQVVLDGTKQNNVDNVGSEETADQDIFRGWYDAMHSPLSAKVKAGTNDLPPYKIPKITRAAGESEGVPGRN